MRNYKILCTFLITSLLTIFLFSARAGAGETLDEKIARLNREIKEKGWHWTAGKTDLSGLSHEESQKLRGLLPIPDDIKSRIPLYSPMEPVALPESFDWRYEGGTTPAKNQGGCGACWAFAATAQLEAHTYIYDGRIEDYSEQAVMDCNPWNQGCGGGNCLGAYSVFTNYGAVAESCVPYLASSPHPCTQTSCESLAKMSGYSSVSNTITSIKTAIYTDGPVFTSIFAHDNLFSYTSGCYNADYPDSPNHAILIVGWDDSGCAGNGAWIIKNSWGTSWGDEGFGRIQYGVCSIGSGTYTIDYIPSNVYVNVDTPNGAETLDVGTGYQITWETSRSVPDSISILLSLDSGTSFPKTIVTALAGSSTSYSWNVSNWPVETARVKVVAYYGGTIGGYDHSDADFTITGLPRRYVSSAGSNSYPYSLPEWAAHSIQDAVDAANSGDSVFVAGDTYSSSISTVTPVYLYGGWDSAFETNDPSTYTTTLSANGSLIMFSSITSGMCGVEGFALSGGTGTPLTTPQIGNYGGGVLCYNSPYCVIKNNVFTGCGYLNSTNFSGGGAIACVNVDSVLISGNEMSASEAQSGGGVFLYQADAAITGNRITGSLPDPGYSGTKNGGGIYASYSSVDLSGNFISASAGYQNGGGIYSEFAPVTLSGDTITLNDCTGSGGGIYSDHSALTISNSVITENSASTGGGVYFVGESCHFSNSLFSLNESGSLGGALYADSIGGNITNNTFDRNFGTYTGGNIFIITPVGLDITNNIITYGDKNGILFSSTDNLTFQYNNTFGNTPEDVITLVPDSTNISMNPFYADTTAMDYHLALHSGSIDAGDPAGAADPDGSRADQGIYGGPGALMAAPDYVKNLTASASSDTTISLNWDELSGGDLDYYAVYGDTFGGFLPEASVFLGSVSVGTPSFSHHPVDTCWYYRVSGVNTSGYAGGYSNQDGACASGEDLTPPTVTVVYPNGGESVEAGDTLDLQWIATDNVGIDSVSIFYSTNAGGDYSQICGAEPNDSLYKWIVPSTLSDSCLVRVVAYDPSLLTGEDESDSLFAIESFSGIEEGEDDEDDTPSFVNALKQNYPNPFNGTTTIAYSVAEPGVVDLRIFDTSGRLIRILEKRDRTPGTYSALWNGKDNLGHAVTSGVYFCRIKVNKFSQSRKIIYLR